MSSADKTKLDGIEASADVTDATNVASAGALMASSPQLTGHMDVQNYRIGTTTANGSIRIKSTGTGNIQAYGDTNPGAIQFMCEGLRRTAQSSRALHTQTTPAAPSSRCQLPTEARDSFSRQTAQVTVICHGKREWQYANLDRARRWPHPSGGGRRQFSQSPDPRRIAWYALLRMEHGCLQRR